MAENTSNYRALVGGSGITVLKWAFPGEKEHVIAFAREVTVRVPKPVAEAVDVQPLDQIRPIEVVTAYAQGRGEIDLILTQLYNLEAWQRLSGLANSQDFVDIARLVASQNNGIKIVRVITPPVPNHASYVEEFHNCVLTTIGDDMPVNIQAMLLDKTLTFGFTHYLKKWINKGIFQFDQRPIGGSEGSGGGGIGSGGATQ